MCQNMFSGEQSTPSEYRSWPTLVRVKAGAVFSFLKVSFQFSKSMHKKHGMSLN